MNNTEERIANAIGYWSGHAFMRRYLGYKGGDLTIFEDGSSYFDSPDWERLILDEDLIMMFLAGMFMADPWLIVESQLLSLDNPDMRRVREILTYDYRQDCLPPQDMGVISQDDAILLYWERVKDIMLDSRVEWACECLRDELEEDHALSGSEIDALLDKLYATQP